MDWLVIGAHGYSEMVVMLISLVLEMYFLGNLLVSVGSLRGIHLYRLERRLFLDESWLKTWIS